MSSIRDASAGSIVAGLIMYMMLVCLVVVALSLKHRCCLCDRRILDLKITARTQSFKSYVDSGTKSTAATWGSRSGYF